MIKNLIQGQGDDRVGNNHLSPVRFEALRRFFELKETPNFNWAAQTIEHNNYFVKSKYVSRGHKVIDERKILLYCR